MCGSAGEFRYSADGLDDAARTAADPAARHRGPTRRDGITTVPADPDTTRTNLGSDSVRRIAAPEMWPQERGI